MFLMEINDSIKSNFEVYFYVCMFLGVFGMWIRHLKFENANLEVGVFKFTKTVFEVRKSMCLKWMLV